MGARRCLFPSVEGSAVFLAGGLINSSPRSAGVEVEPEPGGPAPSGEVQSPSGAVAPLPTSATSLLTRPPRQALALGLIVPVTSKATTT